MVKTIQSNNFDEIFEIACGELKYNPDFTCSPRGNKVNELISPILVLTNPRARLLNFSARKADYGFATGEFLWYWTGKNDLESLQYYNKRASNFSDDGKTVNSAYGFRTRCKQDNLIFSQWDACKRSLIDDTDSRRAILLINEPKDNIKASSIGSKDVPCTLSLQFFIRSGRLILHTHMRSNDLIWGLTYDLFSFTLMQEMMMLELNKEAGLDLQLGEYIHTAGSLHLYDRHFDMARDVLTEASSRGFSVASQMEEMSIEGLSLLAKEEEELRTRKVDEIDETKFTGGVRFLARKLNEHRRKRNAE